MNGFSQEQERALERIQKLLLKSTLLPNSDWAVKIKAKQRGIDIFATHFRGTFSLEKWRKSFFLEEIIFFNDNTVLRFRRIESPSWHERIRQEREALAAKTYKESFSNV